MSTKYPLGTSLEAKLAEDHDRCCPLLHSSRMSRNSCTVMAMLRAAARLGLLEAAAVAESVESSPFVTVGDLIGGRLRARANALGSGEEKR